MDDFERFLAEESERDPKFKEAYDALGPEYDLISQIIEFRILLGLTQKQLAERLGTKQSAVSRIESGRANMSLAAVREVAAALDAEVEIRLKPRSEKVKVVASA